MNNARPQEFVVTNGGGIDQIAVDSTINFYIVTGTATLSNDYDLEYDTTPEDGTTCIVFYNATVDNTAQDITLLGAQLTEVQASKPLVIISQTFNGTTNSPIILDFSQSGIIETMHIVAKAIGFAQMADLAAGSIIAGDVTNRPVALDGNTDGVILIGQGGAIAFVTQSGDVIFSKAGVSAIQAGVIVDAMINASAGIALSKLESSTIGFIPVVSGSGFFVAVAMTGDIAIDGSGVTAIQGNVIDASMLNSDAALVPFSQYLSFESGELQDNDFIADFDGEIVGGEASVTTTIGATDDANIQFKIDGTNVTNGLMTFTAGSAVGDKDSCTPSAANTFSKGQTISMTCTKATDNGGHVNCKIILKRT